MNMKKTVTKTIYIIVEEYYEVGKLTGVDDEVSKLVEEYITTVDTPEKALEIVTSEKATHADGKITYKKVDVDFEVDVDFPEPTYPPTYPRIDFYNRCRTPEDCTNPFHDCINCPVVFRSGVYTTTMTGTAGNELINEQLKTKTRGDK